MVERFGLPTNPPVNSPRTQLHRRRVKRYPGNIELRGQSQSIRVILKIDKQRYNFTLSTTDVREAEEFARRTHEGLKRQLAQQRRRGIGPARAC